MANTDAVKSTFPERPASKEGTTANAGQDRHRLYRPQQSSASCPTCGTSAAEGLDGTGESETTYVYALGRVEARIPTMSVEKEIAQATGRADTAGQTDQQAFHEVLSQKENRYLTRQVCWVMTIRDLETYILQPRHPADIDLLVDALRPAPNPSDIDAVIGVRGPIAPPEMCNGLMVPIVVFDQLYSFDTGALVKAIPKPEKMTAKQFEPAASELFDRIMQMTDNSGATDEHRALNYLALRYDAIYAKTAEAFSENLSLTGVEVRPSRLSGVRNIMDVILTFTNRETDVREMYFVRVDVTEEFPFLVSKLQPFFER